MTPQVPVVVTVVEVISPSVQSKVSAVFPTIYIKDVAGLGRWIVVARVKTAVSQGLINSRSKVLVSKIVG